LSMNLIEAVVYGKPTKGEKKGEVEYLFTHVPRFREKLKRLDASMTINRFKEAFVIPAGSKLNAQRKISEPNQRKKWGRGKREGKGGGGCEVKQ